MKANKPASLLVIVLLFLVSSCHSTASQGNVQAAAPTIWPVTGIPVPELAAYDQAMQQFMSERSITGGALAVMKNGVILFEHGYGWLDAANQTLIPPNALFRWASIIKPVTAAVTKKLASQGTLAMSDKVFCLPDTVGAWRHDRIDARHGEIPPGILDQRRAAPG